MNGIIACETLYPELPSLSPESEFVYVPQWYHEFPIHTPESERANEHLQSGIDQLESRGVDEIIVIYHDPGALEGLQTEGVPLHVYRGRDCIEVQLTSESRGPGDERKRGNTYYLTRGWIDVGVDSYKVYKAYAGAIEELLSQFEAAEREHPSMRVSWPESEQIRNAASRSATMRTNAADLLRPIIESYIHVVLVDTGRLWPFHHEYAESFRDFLESTIGRGETPVSLTVERGSTAELEKIVRTPAEVPDVISLEPGAPVPKETGWRTGPQHT
ncbi:MAG: DUF1638 domain-containing protein [Halodesulfurarchaeum sp.]